MNKIITLLCVILLSFDAFSQSWESIKNSSLYLYGEGWGTSVAEADKQALANLISKIAVHVSSSSTSTDKLTNSNGQIDETSQFSQSVNTFSQATLTNTEQVIIKNEPDAHVGRWIKKTEITKIFEARKRKVLDMVESAVYAETKGKADDALRNYYWALTLLKSLQYPNEVTYTGSDGKSHILTHWIKERMSEVFDDLKTVITKRNGDEVELLMTYKGKPVNSLDYTYFDGRSWSNIYSAKDGRGVLELVSGNISSQIQLKYEYEYRGEAQIDKEIESVLNVVKGTPMPDAYINVMTTTVETKLQGYSKSFTTTNATIIAPPKTMGKEASVYMSITEKVIKSIEHNDYASVQPLFSASGWDMYTKLIKYGRAKVLNSSDIRFYQENGNVMERGLKMAFSFSSGVRKSFVEDVVLLFDKNKKICNVSFGLGNTAEDDIFNKGVWSENARIAIMNFLENYKTAYALKRMDYIKSVFDDDAVIITATVVNKATQNVNMENRSSISTGGNKIIKYNRQTKDQYLKNLERCFARNEFVNIRFANNDVMKLGQGGELYSIQIAQDYYSSTYGDKGYLFLMVDINNPQKPLIKVRTWQPEKDPNFGLYGPGDF